MKNRKNSKILRWIYTSVLFLRLKEFLKNINPVFLKGFSVYDVLKTYYREWRNVKIRILAASISFRFLLALPPTLLFFFTLIPYIPLNKVESTLVNTVQLLIPLKSTAQIIIDVLYDFLYNEKKALLSFSILIAVYYGSNGVLSILDVFDEYASVNVMKRSPFRRRIKSIQLTFLLIIGFILLLAFMIAQEGVVRYCIQKFDITLMSSASVLYYSTIIFVVFGVQFIISSLYYFGPNVNTKWHFFNLGSILATFSILVSSYLLFFIANHFVNYNQIYGSIGSVFIFLNWIFLNTQILILGYTFNHSFDKLKYEQ